MRALLHEKYKQRISHGWETPPLAVYVFLVRFTPMLRLSSVLGSGCKPPHLRVSKPWQLQLELVRELTGKNISIIREITPMWRLYLPQTYFLCSHFGNRRERRNEHLLCQTLIKYTYIYIYRQIYACSTKLIYFESVNYTSMSPPVP